jgi:hypothetical protein
MNDIEFWSHRLGHCLSKHGGLDGLQIAAIKVKYQIEAKKSSPEAAFSSLWDFYGNNISVEEALEDGRAAKAFMEAKASTNEPSNVPFRIAQANLFLKSLQEANKQTIDANPITQMAEHIRKVNENIDKVSFEGIEISEETRQRVKLHMPAISVDSDGYVKRPFYAVCQAAQINGNPMRFDVEITL